VLERSWVDEVRDDPDPQASSAAGSVAAATSPPAWRRCGRSPQRRPADPDIAAQVHRYKT